MFSNWRKAMSYRKYSKCAKCYFYFEGGKLGSYYYGECLAAPLYQNEPATCNRFEPLLEGKYGFVQEQGWEEAVQWELPRRTRRR
jgi:hypothetical protein